MAELPTVQDAEYAVLAAFAKFGVRPDEMLMLRSLMANWDHRKFRMEDLGNALQSLVDAGAIYMKDEGSHVFFLTKEGYRRLPTSSSNHTSQTHRSDVVSPIVNVTGNNARISISSTDNSVNVVHINNAVLDDVVSTLKALPDQEGKSRALKAAEEMKSSVGKEGFGDKYKDFMSSVSDHVSILSSVAPYLGALAAML